MSSCIPAGYNISEFLRALAQCKLPKRSSGLEKKPSKFLPQRGQHFLFSPAGPENYLGDFNPELRVSRLHGASAHQIRWYYIPLGCFTTDLNVTIIYIALQPTTAVKDAGL